jgi:hypothetical protein
MIMAKEQEYESFERSLKAVEDVTKKGCLIDVLDTACLVRKWFDVYAPAATAADIVAMTKIIMQREASRRQRDDS